MWGRCADRGRRGRRGGGGSRLPGARGVVTYEVSRGGCGGLVFDTRDQARLYLFDYIEVFYNRQRHQTGLGHQTPVEFAGGFTP